jgi:hypothetical protein
MDKVRIILAELRTHKVIECVNYVEHKFTYLSVGISYCRGGLSRYQMYISAAI